MRTGLIPNAHRSVEDAGTKVSETPVLSPALRMLAHRRLELLAEIETAAHRQDEAEVLRLTASLIHARDRVRFHLAHPAVA